MTTKCENCGEQFDQSGQERYRSDECLRDGRSQRAKAQTQCASCGENFEYYPSRHTGKYCPPCYADEDRETVAGNRDSESPMERRKESVQCVGHELNGIQAGVARLFSVAKPVTVRGSRTNAVRTGREVATRTTATVGERFDSRQSSHTVVRPVGRISR